MEDIVTMSHGNGGKNTSKIIEEIILPLLGNDILSLLEDGATLKVSKDIVISTDSFVIHPHFFPGGDIGKLSVCGTVNDILVSGGIPKYLTLSLIIEEGFKISDLKKIIISIKKACELSNVKVVTGDIKVVEKGCGHGIYINTAGVGEKIQGISLGKKRIKPKDKIILSGSMGNHGASILCAREKIFENEIESDCAVLNEVVNSILRYGEKVKFLRDPTRGGVATTLKEFVEGECFSIEIEENKLPVDEEVRGVCDLLGLDPLYIANEGKVLAVTSPEVSDEIINDLKSLGNISAAIIGEVVDYAEGKLLLKTKLGGRRILDKLLYDMLPRIC